MQKFRESREKKEFEEQVIRIDRISRTVAGGRRIRFRAAVVVGNRAGKVGIGVAKATEVILAVQKAITSAKKNLITVPIQNETIPHEIEEHYGAAHILLKPASPGTGIIAGGAIRAIADLAGIKNILSKILGSQSQINNLKATTEALKKLEARPEGAAKVDLPVSKEVNESDPAASHRASGRILTQRSGSAALSILPSSSQQAGEVFGRRNKTAEKSLPKQDQNQRVTASIKSKSVKNNKDQNENK